MNLPLLIGYGNTLRSDDGAGVWIVEEFSRRYPGRAQCLVMQQLGPELAEPIARTSCVVFVDASVVVPTVSTFRIEHLKPASFAHSTHFYNPQSLLYSCSQLYDYSPADAYVVHVPVRSLEVGDTLTQEVRSQSEDAVEAIATLLDNLKC